MQNIIKFVEKLRIIIVCLQMKMSAMDVEYSVPRQRGENIWFGNIFKLLSLMIRILGI